MGEGGRGGKTGGGRSDGGREIMGEIKGVIAENEEGGERGREQKDAERGEAGGGGRKERNDTEVVWKYCRKYRAGMGVKKRNWEGVGEEGGEGYEWGGGVAEVREGWGEVVGKKRWLRRLEGRRGWTAK